MKHELLQQKINQAFDTVLSTLTGMKPFMVTGSLVGALLITAACGKKNGS